MKKTTTVIKQFFLFFVCFLITSNIHAQETVTDIDGNTYRTVNINGKQWMIDPLKTTRYNDGTKIPLISKASKWGSSYDVGAFCYYDNDKKNVEKYGNLYNWYAASSGKLAPNGWHVPTETEFNSLMDYLYENYSIEFTLPIGGERRMSRDTYSSKEAGYEYAFKEIGGRYWSSTESRYLNVSSDQSKSIFTMCRSTDGMSVICVKD
ncbi:MAG: FISUMP domain-containing protein [Bacteroidota bacterium]